MSRKRMDCEDNEKRPAKRVKISYISIPVLLPNENISMILSFLDFDDLLAPRVVSKGFNEGVNGILLTRATKTISDRTKDKINSSYSDKDKSGLKLEVDFFGRKLEVSVYKGWNQEWQNLNGIIDYVLQRGNLMGYIEEWERHQYAGDLRLYGRTADSILPEGRRGIQWSREVELVENLTRSSAIKSFVAEFGKIEYRHKYKFTDMYGDYPSDDSVNKERDLEARRIRKFKILCFSFLLSNADTVSRSRTKIEETVVPTFDNFFDNVIVFRLDNDIEICMDI